MQPATFFRRLAAYIADSMVLLGIWLVLQMVFGFNIEEGGRHITVLNLIVSTAYFTYFHATSGATPGKKLMEIRVLSIDDKPLTWLQAFLRYSPYSVFIAMQMFMVVDPKAPQLDPAIQVFFIGFLMWHVVSIYLIMARLDRRTLHDLLAYTQVLYIPQRKPRAL